MSEPQKRHLQIVDASLTAVATMFRTTGDFFRNIVRMAARGERQEAGEPIVSLDPPTDPPSGADLPLTPSDPPG